MCPATINDRFFARSGVNSSAESGRRYERASRTAVVDLSGCRAQTFRSLSLTVHRAHRETPRAYRETPRFVPWAVRCAEDRLRYVAAVGGDLVRPRAD
jgi:hypothetical protein